MFWKRPQVLDVLNANNLKFVADEQGRPVLNLGRKAGMLSIEATDPVPFTPKALYAALGAAGRAEKEFMRTGKRPLRTDNKPLDSDYGVARLIASHLTNKSLNMLASRGLHGRYAGDRAAMEKAVTDLLYKGTFPDDLYTGAPILGMNTQMGHTTPNSADGVVVRPEHSVINMSLHDSEGNEKLEAIRRKEIQLNAMANLQNNPELINDPDIARLVMGDKSFVNDFLKKAGNYGFNISPQIMQGMRANDINKMQTQGVVVGNVVNK